MEIIAAAIYAGGATWTFDVLRKSGCRFWPAFFESATWPFGLGNAAAFWALRARVDWRLSEMERSDEGN
jgi:hypothetical protein